MASQGISPTQFDSTLAVPLAVKLSTQFATDIDEAEQGISLKPIIQIEKTMIGRDERTLSNASSTDSNATTLVDEEHDQNELSKTQSQPLGDDDGPQESTFIRLKKLAAAISFPKAGLQDEKEDFVKEQCDETYPLGWPRLAAFQNMSDSCAVYRRFGLLFSRNLLQLQAELTVLEKELLQLDIKDAADVNMHYRLRSSDDDETWDPALRNLLKRIQQKLSIYGDLLDKDARLRQLGPAPARNHQNVYNWMCHHRPLEKGHDDFIFRNQDFITPIKRSQQWNGINDFIEAFINRWPQGPFTALLGLRKQRADREGDDEMYLFSCRRVTLIANVIVVCIAISVLLIPIFVLYMADITRVQSSGVVLVFTVLFATMVSLITDTKVENVFMSSCSYCAVLVVFLSNVQPNIVTVPSSGQG